MKIGDIIVSKEQDDKELRYHVAKIIEFGKHTAICESIVSGQTMYPKIEDLQCARLATQDEITQAIKYRIIGEYV